MAAIGLIWGATVPRIIEIGGEECTILEYRKDDTPRVVRCGGVLKYHNQRGKGLWSTAL